MTHQGLNILASYLKALSERNGTAVCSDQNNSNLYGKELAGKIICLPQTIGSTALFARLIFRFFASTGI
ncbi:MAG: DUF126 domain-containing protein [Tepidanaerobacteraceae bacterium]|nr:DUF126 domain-containing protein [Tepidanaerobacteraceae bacterium]